MAGLQFPMVTGGGDENAAPDDAEYITLADDPNLSADRFLAGTPNQVLISDGGPNAAITLSTPQDIGVASEVTFGGLTISGVIKGGSIAGDELTLRGSTAPNLGQIRIQSPLDFDDVSPATALNPFLIRYNATVNYAGGFIGGGISFNPTVTFSNGLFIYGAMNGNPDITSEVDPTFAAFILFQGVPTLRAGSGGFNPLAPIMFNSGGTLQNDFNQSVTTSISTGYNYAQQLKTTLSGADLTVDALTALHDAPTYSTVTGSNANFGTNRSVWAKNIVAGFLQPALGTETQVARYVIDAEDLSFGGNVPKAIVRSQLSAASNAFFLQNLGTAKSFFADNAAIFFGDAEDASMVWDGSNFIMDPDVQDNGGKFIVENRVRINSASFPALEIERSGSSTNSVMTSTRFIARTSNDMVNGHGSSIFFALQDDTSIVENVGYFSFERTAGFDDSGLFKWFVYDQGVATEVFNVDASEFVVLEDFAHEGTNLGFYNTTPVAQSATYTPTNVTPDRAYDANSTSIDELADVLGTLIADLKLTGLIG